MARRSLNHRAQSAAGYETAVTPPPGMAFPESARASPRCRASLNGNRQDARIVQVLTSAAATAM
jgi:hypothetical protein